MFKPVLFKLWKFKPHNVQTSLGSNNYIDQTTDYYISISLNSSSNCTGTATTATTWPRSCHAPCCSALLLWCLPCRGAVHRRRVMAHGTRPLEVSRHGVAGHGTVCGMAGVVRCAVCGHPTRSSVEWGSARFSAARRVMSRHGAVCSVACGGVV